MAVHRAADIQKHQHFYRIAPLGPFLHVQPACPCGCVDRGIQIELRAALPRPAAQGAQGQFQGARTQLGILIQIAELALFPDLHGAVSHRHRRSAPLPG